MMQNCFHALVVYNSLQHLHDSHVRYTAYLKVAARQLCYGKL